MKIHVKLGFLLAIYYLFFISCANANNLSCISKNDIKNLVESLEQKKDILRSEGIYIDLDVVETVPKDSLYKIINDKGYIKLFPNKMSYQFFLQYLKKIQTTPNLFINKEITYNKKDVSYIFTLSCLENEILIQINENRYVEEFGESECSYMYYFKKINNQIYLLRMNLAG